jgi:hypothetical protein
LKKSLEGDKLLSVNLNNVFFIQLWFCTLEQLAMLDFTDGDAVENRNNVFAPEVGIAFNAPGEIPTGAAHLFAFEQHPVTDFALA